MHEAVAMYEECYTDTALARESVTVFTLTFPTVDLSTYQWPQPHWLPHISCVVWNDTNYKASVETYTYRQTLISHMTCGGVGAWSSSLQVRWKLRWRIVRVSKYTWTLCNWKLEVKRNLKLENFTCFQFHFSFVIISNFKGEINTALWIFCSYNIPEHGITT